MTKKITLFMALMLATFILAGCVAIPPAESLPKETLPKVTFSETMPVLPGTPDPPEKIQENTPPQIQNQTVKPDTSIVTDRYTEVFTWTSGAGNDCEVHITIPGLNLDAPFARAFNQEMDEYAQHRINEIQECVNHSTDPFLVSINYEAYRNRDILSIVIIADTPFDLKEYKVYNFDLEDQESLTVADMCDEVLDLDYPQFLKASSEWIIQQFSDRFGEEAAEYIAEFTDDAVHMLQSALYLGENGQRMFVYDAPSIAGASYYPTVIEWPADLKIPSARDAYTWFFDLAKKVDGAYAEAYSWLLRFTIQENTEDFGEALAKRTPEEIKKIANLLIHAFYDQAEELMRLAQDIDIDSVRKAITDLIR